jgi:hypothetical protein
MNRDAADTVFHVFMQCAYDDPDATLYIDYTNEPYALMPFINGAPHKVPMCCMEDLGMSYVYRRLGTTIYFTENGDRSAMLTKTQLSLRLQRRFDSPNLNTVKVLCNGQDMLQNKHVMQNAKPMGSFRPIYDSDYMDRHARYC